VNSRLPPQSVNRISRAGGRASPRAVILSCGCLPLEVIPSSRRHTGSALPPRGFDRHAVSKRGVPRGVTRRVSLPQASAPLQSLTRGFRRSTPSFDGRLPLRSPEVSSPTAPSFRQEPPLPGIPTPGSRCVLAVPARFDALLPRRSPRCVSTGRALGVLPSELLRTQVACAFRRRFPSCDWRTRRHPRIRIAPVPDVRRRDGLPSATTSLQGFLPSVASIAVHGSPRSGSTVGLSWGFASLGLSPSLVSSRSRSGPSLLSGTLGLLPFWVLFPVLQSVKERGSLACLFRGCRPLRGFRPRPRRSCGCPKERRGVGPTGRHSPRQAEFFGLIAGPSCALRSQDFE
jgi:hypothetical protein